jgi:7-keto-8-aminopelargonate synthetase-like enzyme
MCSSSISKEKVIITDSVFSMDGDHAPLSDIVTIAKNSTV